MKTQNWKELEVCLSDSVLKTIEELKFPYMTPVQVKYYTVENMFIQNRYVATFLYETCTKYRH